MNYTKMAKYLIYEAALNIMPSAEDASGFGRSFGVDREAFTDGQLEKLTEALRREQDRLGDRMRKQRVIE
jgi:hypothetical protein